MSDFSHAFGPPTLGRPLLIVGASARAAAESARRAGFRPYAIDLFADADLAELAEVRVSRDYPYDIPTLARAMPAADWIYVGGLENYPEVVDELAAERRLLGCSGDLLRRVRDPRLLSDELCRHGVNTPDSIFDSVEFRRQIAGDTTAASELAGPIGLAGEWLVKRRRSSGGLGVAHWQSERIGHTLEDVFDRDCYLQRRVVGASLGAVYLASRSRTDFLGASYQLTYPSHDGKQPFRYAGSIGPIPFEGSAATELRDKLNSLGSLATSGFPVSGIFSLDFILGAGTQLKLLEINPRYTASCELIERSLGRSLVGLHAAVCEGEIDVESVFVPPADSPQPHKWHGKKVVYATADLAQVPEHVTADLMARRAVEQERLGESTIADIPQAGAMIRRDDPIATVFAAGDDEQAVRDELDERERELIALFVG